MAMNYNIPVGPEAAVDLVDQASIFNIGNQTGGQGFYTGQEGKSSGLLGSLTGLFGGVGDLVRSSRGSSEGPMGILGNPFDPRYAEEATAKIDTETARTLQQLGGIVNDIAYLTGSTTPEAVQEFRNRYKDYFEPAAQRGYNQLFNYEPGSIGTTPISEYGDRATNKIYDTMGKYSALNRQNYMDIATKPPTVEVDTEVFQPQFDKYMDEANKKLYDYSGSQTQDFISGAGKPGSRYSRQRMAGFFADAPEVKRLMDFGA